MRPMRSPSSTVSEMLRNSGVAPNCLVTDCALRIGGISSKDTWFAAFEDSRMQQLAKPLRSGKAKASIIACYEPLPFSHSVDSLLGVGRHDSSMLCTGSLRRNHQRQGIAGKNRRGH